MYSLDVPVALTPILSHSPLVITWFAAGEWKEEEPGDQSSDHGDGAVTGRTVCSDLCTHIRETQGVDLPFRRGARPSGGGHQRLFVRASPFPTPGIASACGRGSSERAVCVRESAVRDVEGLRPNLTG